MAIIFGLLGATLIVFMAIEALFLLVMPEPDVAEESAVGATSG